MTSSDSQFSEARAELDRAIAGALGHAEAADDMTSYWRATQLYDTFDGASTRASRLRVRAAKRIREAGQLSFMQLGQKLGVGRQRAADMVRAAGRDPEARPVVAAVITSPLGVLITQRVDGKPPWGFLTGEIEPGESATDAAIREAKEEAGLAIRPVRELGRRIHPATKRTMIYLAAHPAGDTEVSVGDPAELAEIRWASLAEAEDLLPGMFENVRAYLARSLRRQAGD